MFVAIQVKDVAVGEFLHLMLRYRLDGLSGLVRFIGIVVRKIVKVDIQFVRKGISAMFTNAHLSNIVTFLDWTYRIIIVGNIQAEMPAVFQNERGRMKRFHYANCLATFATISFTSSELIPAMTIASSIDCKSGICFGECGYLKSLRTCWRTTYSTL